MKRLYFLELLVTSRKERAARKITFDRKATIIKGPNDTGKSALIKTIYRTLGAEPPEMHSIWEAANTSSALTFDLDGNKYTMLRDGRRYTLFDAKKCKIEAFDRITTQMSPYFAKLFSFHLELQARRRGENQATPAFLFLPFYIDQDRSWHSSWESFLNLQQFGKWTKDVVEYHTGIKPNEYYRARRQKQKASNRHAELKDKKKVLDNVLRRLEKRFAHAQYDLGIETYKEDIERLLLACKNLKEHEDELKKKLVALYNEEIVMRSQIKIAENAAKELSRDYKYATFELAEKEVMCPTCNAHYENSFAQRFAIAQDEDLCQEMLAELRDKLAEIEKEIKQVKSEYSDRNKELFELREILETKKGEITLKRLIENEGKKEALGIVQRDIKKVRRQIQRLANLIKAFSSKMNKVVDRKKATSIQENYMSYMGKYLWKLDVQTLNENDYKTMTGKFKESGSDKPRALLAYYFSILQTINEYSTSTFCPIVIDSPKQQDQDEKNWQKILTFIRDEQPSESQLILALVDTSNVDFPAKTIELSEKLRVLSKEHYDEVMTEMRPLLEQAVEF